jgi:hypothetical protein
MGRSPAAHGSAPRGRAPERGETVFGAAFRTVPFQYVWAVLALLVLLAVMYLKPLVKLLLS